MYEVKLSWGKRSLDTVLSLGIMVLGIGCISLALFNILAQSDYSALPEYPVESVLVESNPSIILHTSSKTPYPLYPAYNVHPSDTIDAKSNPTLAVPASDKTQYPVYPTEGVTVESKPSTAEPIPNKPLYLKYPAKGDVIGSLTIPALKKKLPIIEGTGTAELKKGVGHFIGSVLPGEEDNCVLSGHRDTVFAKLGKLKIGDQLIVQTSAGTFTYEINGIRIVHKDDKSVIVHVNHAVLTLTTCYPFRYIGNAPDRYILTAILVISK